MKILVIGGAGYIGSHCVRQLVAAGHEPVIVDDFSYGHRDAISGDVKTYEGDIHLPDEILNMDKVELNRENIIYKKNQNAK